MLIIRETNIRVELRPYRADTHLEIVNQVVIIGLKLYKKSDKLTRESDFLFGQGERT